MNTDTITVATTGSDTGSSAHSSVARRGPLRRRFTFAAVGTLAVLMAVLGVNFAGDTGTGTTSITGKAGIAVTTGTPQSWSVSVGSAGSVPAPTAVQNIATIDPANSTSAKMLISVYVTNLSELAVNYSSWTFNLELYNTATPTPAKIGDTLVATSDSGVVSWVVTVDTALDYNLKLAAGGSFYTIATNTTTGSLSPEFFVRATQL